MSKPLLSISKLANAESSRIPGYFVASTAPINVEGDHMPKHQQQVQPLQQTPPQPQQEKQNINTIADLLYQKVANPLRDESNCVELIISIHGFSNSKEATQNRFAEIYDYINKDDSQPFKEQAENLMYIGYRWPSEPLMGSGQWIWEKAYHAVVALPIILRVLLIFGSLGILASLFLHPAQLFMNNPLFYFLFSIIILILTGLFFFAVSLVVLRLLVYFRDNYRATNFGVPDLVEFLRQLDQALVKKAKERYIPDFKLIAKLKELLLHKLKLQLELREVKITEQTILVLEDVCEQVIKYYAKDRTFGSIDIEYLNQVTKGIKSEIEIDKIVAIVEEVLKQDTDQELVRLREAIISILENKARRFWNTSNRIKLTFIGHSMGGYVVTNVVRILSDIFDFNSVGSLESTNKIPPSDVGHVFSLGRLVLVSPDIPINSILSGRSNFLRSSLRRFQETYLFTNEGDLALRLASTIANYFSFPARTRESGYRLGNVAIRDNLGYGIVNLSSLGQQHHQALLENLFVDSFSLQKSLAQLQASFRNLEAEDYEQIARLFTYFDCTDYTDKTIEPNAKKRQVLTLKRWRWEPRWIYYLRLAIAYALGIKDTHSGYFQGQFTQKAMYRIAFLGFGGFLDSISQERISALHCLSQECCQRKIQVILSPERYYVDLLRHKREQVRREMLNA